MTKASKDIVGYIHRLDELKRNIGLIKDENLEIAFTDEAFSMFPLYYAASKKMGFDVLEFESEAIATLIGNEKNGDRVNAVLSTTARGDAWVNTIAFDMFVDAVSGADINPRVLSPDTAEDMISAIIVLSGIEGSIAIPLKTDVVGFVVACLKHDGWTIPPLAFMFKNIEDMFFENTDEIKQIKEIFGNLSIVDIATMSPEQYRKIKAPSYLANYFMRNQELAIHIINYMNKTMFDWTTIISGE